jgi:branched-chain amino acid aminotransferase
VFASVDGDLVAESDAGVPVRDPGVGDGAAATITCRAFGGSVLAWHEYASRMRGAARAVGIDPVPDAGTLADRVGATLSGNDLVDARVRVSVTAGVRAPTTTVVVDPLPRGGVTDRTTHPGPAALHTADTRSIPPASVPMARWTHNRLDRRLAAQEATAAEADEALLVTGDGRVVGGADSELFVMGTDALAVPQVDTPADPLREVVVGLAGDEGLPVRRAPLEPSDVRRGDEVFLVNPTWGVRPVASLDGEPIGTGDSPVTALLTRLFDEHVERTCYDGGDATDARGDPT